VVRYLLERNVARIVGRAVIGLLVDAEGRETAIVSRADTLLTNITGRRDQLIAHLLSRFRSWALRDDAANIGGKLQPEEVREG
jgi:hypothetical protein